MKKIYMLGLVIMGLIVSMSAISEAATIYSDNFDTQSYLTDAVISSSVTGGDPATLLKYYSGVADGLGRDTSYIYVPWIPGYRYTYLTYQFECSAGMSNINATITGTAYQDGNVTVETSTDGVNWDSLAYFLGGWGYPQSTVTVSPTYSNVNNVWVRIGLFSQAWIVTNLSSSVSDFIVTADIGDPCNPDEDNDGVRDIADNCPLVANAGQEDNDGDGAGDVCDSDDDNDGVADGADNCPNAANPNQADADGDGAGDVCDSDRDSDGVLNENDNCPNAANSDQADNDLDGAGDACDLDDDNDDVPDTSDNCPLVVNSNQADADGDGIGNVCDVCPNDPQNDADGDGFCGDVDNCPNAANPDQANNDGDGLGDVCDPDDDNDGVPDIADNCPLVANAGQEDNDGDGAGDVCDSDDDNDGVDDVVDNCPTAANSDQADCDDDGIGDACDEPAIVECRINPNRMNNTGEGNNATMTAFVWLDCNVDVATASITDVTINGTPAERVNRDTDENKVIIKVRRSDVTHGSYTVELTVDGTDLSCIN